MSILTLLLSAFLATANPGTDASREININWHCYNQGSTLQLTKEGDTEFKKAKSFAAHEELWSTDRGDSLSALPRYVCRVELKKLKKGTKYLYRIVDNGIPSETRSFTTATGKKEWKFIAFADFQLQFNNLTHPLVATIKSVAGDANLAVCSGDITDFGSNEAEWRHMMDHPVWNDMVFAATPGDHAYWCHDQSHPIMMRENPDFFRHFFNLPSNGIAECTGSNYYFFYNNILFIGLDMCDSNTVKSDIFEKEAEWLKKIAAQYKGKYRWLVVLGHKSIFGSPVTDSGVVKYIQPLFAPAFKEAGVDLVISGHDHKYSRTHEIDGTYYLDLGSSGNKFREPEEAMYHDGIHDKVINLKADQRCVGAVISVSDSSLTVEVRDTAGILLDSFTKF